MIVAFDATAIGSGLGGDETLVGGLLRGLVAVGGADVQVHVLAAAGAHLPPEVLEAPTVHVEYARRRPGALHFGAVLPLWLAGLARRRMAPHVVVTNTHAPVHAPAPVALMVPDLSFEHLDGAYPTATRVRLQQLVRHQVPHAAVVLTISEFSRSDICTTYGLDPSRVVVVPLVPDPPGEADPAVRRQLTARGVRPPYVVYLGNLHPRKNVARLVRAFTAAQAADPRLADHRLVVAGRPWFGSTAERDAAREAPEGSVVLLERVTDAEREVLLRDADALGYVSTFEGFGLPPLEAMARGTAVLGSSTTAVGEVCTGAALLVDPTDTEAISAGLSVLLTDATLRGSLEVAGRARAAEFSLERTGLALLTALQRVVVDTEALV